MIVNLVSSHHLDNCIRYPDRPTKEFFSPLQRREKIIDYFIIPRLVFDLLLRGMVLGIQLLICLLLKLIRFSLNYFNVESEIPRKNWVVVEQIEPFLKYLGHHSGLETFAQSALYGRRLAVSLREMGFRIRRSFRGGVVVIVSLIPGFRGPCRIN